MESKKSDINVTDEFCIKKCDREIQQKSQKFVIENGIVKSEKKIFELENANLGEWILETLRSKLNFVGQVDSVTGEECTFEKMANESVRCALWLRKQGLRPGDIVLTYTHNHMFTYIPIIATLYNGAAHIFGFEGNYPEMVRTQLRRLKPKFIFTVESKVKVCQSVLWEEKMDSKIVVFTPTPGLDSLNDILKQSEVKEVDDFCIWKPSNPHDDCLLLFTSGSTGVPKIVVHSYKTIIMSLLTFIEQNKQYENVTMYYVPLYWSSSQKLMLVDILTFAKRIIVRETSWDLHEAFELIEKYKVTNVRFSIGMIYRMYKTKEIIKYDTSSIKIIKTCGVKLQPEFLKFMIRIAQNGELYQVYGTSEIASDIFAGTMNNIDIESAGYLRPNFHMKVIDVRNGKILGPKEKGEICLKTPFLFKGYFEDPEATEQAFDSEGWYHTGDLGYYDETGLGYVLGRVKNSLIDAAGKIVPLWDVQRILLLNTEVIEAIILSDSEMSSNHLKLFAFVLLAPGAKITKSELEELANSLSNITIPVTVKIVNHLPLTPNGKIKLNELEKLIHAENITTRKK